MRLATALAIGALIASPALAQTPYADSSGGYIALRSLSLGSTDGFNQRAIDGTVGYRFGAGTDVGLRIARRTGFASTLSLGPTVGVSRPLSGGFTARLEGSVLGSQTSGYSRVLQGEGISEQAYEVQIRSLRADLMATVSRPLRLAGSVRLHPTLGVFAQTGVERVTIDGPGMLGERPSETRTGLHVALPLSFRLFGQTASIAPAVRFPLGRQFRFEVPGDADVVPGGGAYAGGGLRLNF